MEIASKVFFPFSDLALARRLEKTEARSNAEFVETRAKLFPDSCAQWIEVAGTYAMYDGVKSPVTQTFGLGLFQKVTSSEIEVIENFFRGFGAPVFHEVSPLADLGVFTLLNERNYQPVEFTSVMFLPLQCNTHSAKLCNERIQVRLIKNDEQELWVKTTAQGWMEFPEFANQMLEIGQISVKRPGALAFLAGVDDYTIAGGVMSICDGVALLSGASTIPEARKQGAQQALLESRLRYAAEAGCEIAMMCALPGSTSQRNAERNGFRIAYTRIKWQLTQGVS